MPVRRVTLGAIGEIVRENVRTLRTSQELTQAQLANMADLPSQAITEIENGARRVDVDDLVAIAQALKTPVHRILGTK